MRAELERLAKQFRAESDGARDLYDMHGDPYDLGASENAESAAEDITRILTASDWIPVSERLPEHEGWYIGCVYHGGEPSFPAYWIDGEWCGGNTSDSDRDVDVTHWQELPAPYRAEGGGG